MIAQWRHPIPICKSKIDEEKKQYDTQFFV